MITEYDVGFALKEYLYHNNWRIITWNPPGSQGTFTIPNPSKDPSYRGQTGSSAPDLIAYKGNDFLIVEIKDKYRKIFKDIEKLLQLLDNKPRLNLLLDICENISEAKEYDFNRHSISIKTGIAFNYDENHVPAEIEKEYKDLDVFMIKGKVSRWTNKRIEAPVNASDLFQINHKII